MSKDMYLCHLWEIHPNNGEKNYWYCYKIWIRCSKERFLVYKTAEATGELIRKITVKQKVLPDLNSRNNEEVVILPKKRKKY